MIKHKCYINDNYLILKTDKINKLLTKSIINGEIIDKKIFIQDFKKNIKLNNILSTKITILLNKYPSEMDYLYYSNIFEELNYSSIELTTTSNILENDTLIPNNNYYIIFHNQEFYYIYKYLLDSYLIYNNIKKLKIISGNKLPLNKQCKYYYYANYKNYFIN